MRRFSRFLFIGLLLGLFTEIQLHLVARINPGALIMAGSSYPVIVSLAHLLSQWLDRLMASRWSADVLHCAACGGAGLAVEGTVLGNGPESPAFQPGMFAMWTVSGFGPHLLTRDSGFLQQAGRQFWAVYAVASLLLTGLVLWGTTHEAKLAVAIWGLSATYIVWSVWLFRLGWRTGWYMVSDNLQLEGKPQAHR